jgi:hypothetical protein
VTPTPGASGAVAATAAGNVAAVFDAAAGASYDVPAADTRHVVCDLDPAKRYRVTAAPGPSGTVHVQAEPSADGGLEPDAAGVLQFGTTAAAVVSAATP